LRLRHYDSEGPTHWGLTQYTDDMPERDAPTDALPPDPVIEAYKKDIDRALLREALKQTVEERLRALLNMHEVFDEFARARQRAR